MKVYALIFKGKTAFLREKNPLEGTRLVSVDAYDEHEKLYIESALRLLDPVPDKHFYTENEIRAVWLFTSEKGATPEKVSDTNFIETRPQQYEQVFEIIDRGSYQDRVKDWLTACFGAKYLQNTQERNFRLLEEVLELVQSLGMAKEEVLKQVVYTYARPPGDPTQEVGGVLVTLAGLCACNNIDMITAGEIEIANNIRRTPEIKAKHLLKIKTGIAI